MTRVKNSADAGGTRRPEPESRSWAPTSPTGAEFETALAASVRPLFVSFYASWCPACRRVRALMDRLARRLGDRIRFARVDIDEEPELATRYEIDAVPTFVLFERGKAKAVIPGLPSPVLLGKFLDRVAAIEHSAERARPA